MEQFTQTDSILLPDGKPTILIVDDSAGIIALLQSVLSPQYKVMAALDAEVGLRLANSPPVPDLILLDVVMPGIDGFEMCRRIKESPSTHDIPVIFLTSRSSPEDEERGFDIGAVDYIAKPISIPLVLARVRNHLKLKAVATFLRDKNAFLEAEVQRRTRDLQAIQDVTIMVLASLAETRDVDTGNHIRRTQLYVKALAQKLATQPRFADTLDEHTIELICKSAPLHDIGKVGIPDAVLRKQAQLRPDEFEVMKTHTRLGRDAIEHAELKLGHEVPFLRYAKEIAFCHQEKWDGSGYPQGLKGEEIPLCARLMAVADVYDALISRRVYKEPLPHDEAVRLIVEGRGSHFDPTIVDAFVLIADSFRAISRAYADDSERDAANALAEARLVSRRAARHTLANGTHDTNSSP